MCYTVSAFKLPCPAVYLLDIGIWIWKFTVRRHITVSILIIQLFHLLITISYNVYLTSIFLLVTVAGQCIGHLPENQALQIRVMKKNPQSACVLKLDSVIMDTVTIASGNQYELDTFDCYKEELEWTVNQTIGTQLCVMIHPSVP